jgi:hypothetical protein
MKKVLLIALSLVFISLIVSCSSRIPLTASEVVGILEQSDYYIANTGLNDTGIKFIEALDPEDKFIIWFSEYDSAEQARTAFNEIRNDFNSVRGSWSSRVENNTANYNIYRVTTNGIYYVASRIDNTLLYIVTEEENRSAVDEILETLGYK